MVEWFYGKEGQQYGPIDEATLRARITTGEVGPHDLIWSEGMAAWTPLSQLPQFGSTGGVPPQISGAVADPPLEGVGSTSPYAPPVASPMAVYPAGPVMPGTNGLAIASMICGILSLLCGGVFLGIPAVICGHLALNRLKNPDNHQVGRGMAIAGLVCGYAGLAFTAIFLLVILAAV